MDYKQWLDLFGQTTEDERVRDELAKAGVEAPPVIPKDETDARVELEGLMLIFTDEALFPHLSDVGEGSGILTGLVLILKDPKRSLYLGPLPFELRRDDSRETLRARFGAPAKENQRFRWDEWEVDGLVLRVTYAEGFGSLQSISVKLPRPD